MGGLPAALSVVDPTSGDYAQPMLNRRGFLAGAAGAGALAVGACSPSGVDPDPGPPDVQPPAQNCRTPEALADFSRLGGAPIRYEISGIPQRFRADPKFIGLLEAWAADWVAVSGLGPLTAISTYGAHVDKCNSWHQAGRAFDFAAVEHGDTTISCRYDLFGEDEAQLRSYWRLAASVAKHFSYTLTYRYNEQHHNHIHIDNGLSGYDPPTFDERSAAQVTLVQSVARYVFGEDGPTDGSFGGETRGVVRAIQQRVGISRPLGSREGWVAFLDAATSG